MRQPSPAPESGPHLLDYVRVLLKRIWLILGVFATVVVVVLFATYRATPLYRATAVINIRQPNQVLGRLDPTELIRSVSNSEVYMNTRYVLLSSRTTAEQMVARWGLKDWPEFRGVKEGAIVRTISNNVEVEPRRNTSLVKVSVVNANPTLAMKLANKLVQTFKELQKTEAQSAVEDQVDSVESKWLTFQQKASLEQGALRRLMQEHNTDLETFLENYEYSRDRLRRKKELIDQQKEKLATDRPFYEQILKVKEGGNGTDDGLASLFGHPSLRKDETIRLGEQDLALLKSDLTRELKKHGENWPSVTELRKQIADKQAVVEHEKRSYLLGYVASYEELSQTIGALEEQLDEIESEFRSLSALKREYDEKMDRVESYKAEESRYFSLLEKLQDARTHDYEPVSIAQTASEPIAPFKPNRQLNLILALVFGLLGGVGVAFFLEYLDDTIKTKEELERITQTQLFGVIPHMPARRRGDISGRDLFVYTEPKSTIAEAFRGIRTALAYSSQKGENQVYLVTSAGPKEGKSTIGINLATVMAFDDTKTILVDADLRRPRVHRSFDLQNDRGLSNLIIGDSSLDDVVQPTGLENLGNLHILPSGPIPPNPSELLGRDRVTEILLELRERYDRVLIDSPPVGAVTDAVVLGRIVDTVILVVHAGRTRKKLVERGLEQLGQVEVDVAGVVLNNLKISRKRYYPGYYHYYYYYSSYYGSESKPTARKPEKERTGA